MPCLLPWSLSLSNPVLSFALDPNLSYFLSMLENTGEGRILSSMVLLDMRAQSPSYRDPAEKRCLDPTDRFLVRDQMGEKS